MARGSLVKRSENTWSAIVELGRDEHGKRKQKWVTIKGNRLEAEKELNKLQAAADQGTIAANPKMTLGEYLDVFLREHVDPNLTPKSVRYYHQVCQYYIRPHLGRV